LPPEVINVNHLLLRVAGLPALVLMFLITAGCAAEQPEPAEPPDTRAEDEAAIRSTSQQWVAAAQTKDPARFASFYTDDAIVMVEAAPDVTPRSAIQETLGGMMQDPAFNLTFETTRVEVARSGDIAYEIATFAMTTTDPQTKKPVITKGQGIVIWKKQADGSWKAHVDVPVSDGPPAAQ
jgi:uncharacterized protein (TIGR02246 family)